MMNIKNIKNIWLDGMMGLVVGDALGCPVQFFRRDEILNRKKGPVIGMEGFGTFNMPPGTWTDDSSMSLATIDSIANCGGIDPDDIMNNFMKWEFDGAYTPYGQAFDQGITCTDAIYKYRKQKNWKTCGRTGDHANGNGALMRILPVCLYFIDKNRQAQQISQTTKDNQQPLFSDDQIITAIHQVASLTHNHLRSHIACGLYYFMAKAIVDNPDKDLNTCLQIGLDNGYQHYYKNDDNHSQMVFYNRIYHLDDTVKITADHIKSSGYVVDTLEAVVWCLATTNTLADCLLKAVNLGDDTDTVAAIAGGLAGLYYGADAIPADWRDIIVGFGNSKTQTDRVSVADWIMDRI